MNQLFEQAITRAKALSDQRQNEVGEMLFALMDQEQSALRLSPDQQAEVRRRLASPVALVPESEMQDFFRKFCG